RSGATVWSVLLRSLAVDVETFEHGTGWAIKPEGACRGEVCVPIAGGGLVNGGGVDVAVVADRLGMPLIPDVDAELWALGPQSAVTGRALTTAIAPELELPDVDGTPFRPSSLRGQ